MCVRATGGGRGRWRCGVLCGAVLALMTLVAGAAAGDAGKRAESEYMSPMPFVLGSRYGRSQPRLMSPRNDRFFMGSRYGKRSEPWGGGGTSGAGGGGWPARAAHPLACQPLGDSGLYRCAPAVTSVAAPGVVATANYHYNNRRSEESRELGEEE
uniref:RYamide n=1 Tax=Chilo suppressalis TaxID=168631 RepID=A0A0S1U1U6_CHISP|nr:RYamide precursor [Chilo suppressalis]